MKEFVISEAKVESAILVGLITQTQDERKTMEYLDELDNAPPWADVDFDHHMQQASIIPQK